MINPYILSGSEDLIEIFKFNWMNHLLPFASLPIHWDRYVDFEEWVEIYGWIYRKDKQRDFILFSVDEDEILSWTTSSAKYSKQIHELCDFETDHHPCQQFDQQLWTSLKKQMGVQQ